MTIRSVQYPAIKPDDNSLPTYVSRYGETVFVIVGPNTYVSWIKIYKSETLHLFAIRKYFKLTKIV